MKSSERQTACSVHDQSLLLSVLEKLHVSKCLNMSWLSLPPGIWKGTLRCWPLHFRQQSSLMGCTTAISVTLKAGNRKEPLRKICVLGNTLPSRPLTVLHVPHYPLVIPPLLRSSTLLLSTFGWHGNDTSKSDWRQRLSVSRPLQIRVHGTNRGQGRNSSLSSLCQAPQTWIR